MARRCGSCGDGATNTVVGCQCVVVAGTNTTVTGDGSGGSPYVINSSGTGTSETITTLIDNNDGTLTYTSENGTTTNINILSGPVGALTSNGAGVLTFNPGNGSATTSFNICTLIDEGNCSDSLVVNADGSVTHTALDGTVVIIPAPAASTSDSLVANADGSFTHTAVDGTIVTIPASTSDSMVVNADGSVTHTAVDGTIVIIPAPSQSTLPAFNNGDAEAYPTTATTVTIPDSEPQAWDSTLTTGPVDTAGDPGPPVPSDSVTNNVAYDPATGDITHVWNTVTQIWKNTPNGCDAPVDVREFGTIGTADDSAVFQAAIDSVQLTGTTTLGGGAVCVPEGTYDVNLVLKQGVHLIGAGEGSFSSILRPAADGYVVDSTAVVAGNYGVKNLAFQGRAAEGIDAGAIRYQNQRGSHCRDLLILDFTQEAIRIDFGVTAQISRVFAYNCLLDRNQATPNGVIRTSANDDSFHNMEITSSMSREGTKSASENCHAFFIDGAAGAYNALIGELSDSGFYLTARARHIKMSNCRADLNYMHGWHIAGGSGSIANASSIRNSRDTTNTYDGFHVTAGHYQFSAPRAESLGADTWRHRYGINDTQSSDSIKNAYSIPASVGHTTGAFKTVDAAGASMLFAHNPGITITGDTTPSVSGLSFIRINNQATPITVTNFDDGVAGQVLRILGDGATTLRNGTNIFTSTGADKLLAVLKVYEFIRLGAVWIEVSP